MHKHESIWCGGKDFHPKLAIFRQNLKPPTYETYLSRVTPAPPQSCLVAPSCDWDIEWGIGVSTIVLSDKWASIMILSFEEFMPVHSRSVDLNSWCVNNADWMEKARLIYPLIRDPQPEIDRMKTKHQAKCFAECIYSTILWGGILLWKIQSSIFKVVQNRECFHWSIVVSFIHSFIFVEKDESTSNPHQIFKLRTVGNETRKMYQSDIFCSIFDRFEWCPIIKNKSSLKALDNRETP
jgi:hypothetical protein